ncbi:adenylate/guanylate cyclase domain-containing protein [Fulvivirga lutea]|uniref:Adenylate/guanylate cyclase domain-containing protein n=1 Tax=Fulvivirga lutea TaxID=2810512 RepID=A0A974ZZK9_9BACT|nr:adenylate/guanylate cyclase domain-containing protein [Fulvivirga lutea]QSE95846.1 adenylate/guanylate cyclase domain-containing protein [Fulvivirga lutea]
MNQKLKIQCQKWGIIIIAWIFIGIWLAVYDHLALFTDFSKGPSEYYSFTDSLLFHVSAAFMGSVLGGAWLVFYVNEKLRDKPYSHSIFAVLISFFVIVLFITAILGVVYLPMVIGVELGSPYGRSAYYAYMVDFNHIKNIMFWIVVTFLTQFILIINDKFGHGTLWKIIIGKYHVAVQEERIFMFVDIRSSTTIAEKLGNNKYYELLKDFFSDITDDIISNHGEVYQYVGDEIVISWPVRNGIKNANCLNCYFDMRKTIQGKKEKYMAKYDLIPEFKAGIHFGEVTAGEVGIIKRDITFSGDVLNTASRIQGLCNVYKVDFLISNDLLSIIKHNFNARPIGFIELRGKESKVELSTLSF